MDKQHVQSSNLKAIGYDADSNTLEVTFKKGTKPYYYQNVSQDQYDQLLNARSKGQFFNRFLKSKPFTRGR